MKEQQLPDFRIRVSARRGSAEAERCFKAFQTWAANHSSSAVLRTGPMGYDDLEPLVLIEKPGVPTIWYAGVTADKAASLIDGWLGGGNPRPDLALGVSGDTAFQGIPPLDSLPLFRLQQRVALCRCGLYDPDSLTAYGELAGLAGALKMTPPDVLALFGRAGQREKDGLGSSVTPSWTAFQEINNSEKALVCTAFDSDIGAHTARLLLESDPFGVLEGLLIAAYAVGASRAVLAVPAGIVPAGTIPAGTIPILDNALEQLKESISACVIEVREVPLSLVVNEKTALLRCLEGLQAIPAPPGKDGDRLNGAPALVTGIETLANIPPILRGRGRSCGHGSSVVADTKILTLTGDLPHRYTVEVPFGTKIGDILREIGGANDIKAVQFGGPTGAFIGAVALDKPVSYETAREAGADFGVSLLSVASNKTGAVETAEELMRFLRGESCGKCVFCREGTLHLHRLLGELLGGTALEHDLALMEEVGLRMRSNCLCALGRTAANPVLSSLKLFRPEYEKHIGNS